MSTKNWNYTSTHGKSCAKCVRATDSARTYATVLGSVASTSTIFSTTEEHSGTATRAK